MDYSAAHDPESFPGVDKMYVRLEDKDLDLEGPHMLRLIATKLYSAYMREYSSRAILEFSQRP
jgi:hypothetical protein